jgi:hypothetical protein
MGVEWKTDQECDEDGQDVVYLQGLCHHPGENGILVTKPDARMEGKVEVVDKGDS